jgi:hypothetical protein
MDDAIARLDGGASDSVADLMAELENDPDVRQRRESIATGEAVREAGASMREVDRSLQTMRAAARDIQERNSST